MRTQAEAFNEWMRRFTEEPSAFQQQFQSCVEYLAAAQNGEEPTYGETCAAYLYELMIEDDAAPKVAPPAVSTD